MTKLTVAVDADGVLYDLLGPWIELYNKEYDDSLNVDDIDQYDVTKFVKCSKEELCGLLRREEIWENIQLYDGVYEAIEKLNGHPMVDLVIATATSYRDCSIKFDKIFSMLPMLNERQLIITSRKDLIKANFLIDDWEENLKHMIPTYEVPILVNRTYNRSFPNAAYNITRAADSAEALKLLISYIDKLYNTRQEVLS